MSNPLAVQAPASPVLMTSYVSVVALPVVSNNLERSAYASLEKGNLFNMGYRFPVMDLANEHGGLFNVFEFLSQFDSARKTHYCDNVAKELAALAYDVVLNPKAALLGGRLQPSSVAYRDDYLGPDLEQVKEYLSWLVSSVADREKAEPVRASLLATMVKYCRDLYISESAIKQAIEQGLILKCD